MGDNIKADAVRAISMVISQMTQNVQKIKHKTKMKKEEKEETEHIKSNLMGNATTVEKQGTELAKVNY